MAHSVFIAYAPEDKEIAGIIRAHLEAAGIHCWIEPKGISLLQNPRQATDRAIASSRVMALVFTAHANASDVITHELYVAAQNDVALIPIKIDNAVPVLEKEYYLGRPQWLLAANPLTAEQLQLLVERVQTVLATPTTASKRRGLVWFDKVLILVGLALVLVLAGAFAQFAWIGVPTPVPIAVAPSQTPTITPTPRPTVPPLVRQIITSEKPFEEHFSDPTYENDLPPSMSETCSTEKMVQRAGSLQVLPSTQEQECRIDVRRILELAQFKSLQARFRMSGSSNGNDSLGGVGFRLFSRYSFLSKFTVNCTRSPVQSFCSGVFTGASPYPSKGGEQYSTRVVPIEREGWSTLRVELVNPQTLEWRFIINDVVDPYTVPSERLGIYDSVDFFVFAGPSEGSQAVNVDDIVIEMR